MSSRSSTHIVIEASGIADPATAAAWGTVPGFVPGGVIVLAAADSVVRRARDRYVGSEVLRQLAGADLVLVTKSDLVDAAQLSEVIRWVGSVTDAPIQVTPHDGVAAEVVLGLTPDEVAPSVEDAANGHGDRYVTWAARIGTTTDDRLLDFLHRLPEGVLRVKGEVTVTETSGAAAGRRVQVVGRTVSVTSTAGSRLRWSRSDRKRTAARCGVAPGARRRVPWRAMMIVDRVSPALGADVSGVDLSQIDEAGVEALYRALIEHQVLFLRDQHLSPVDHAAFGRRFGELGARHHSYVTHPDSEDVVVLDWQPGDRPDAAEWHSDMTFTAEPPFASILQAVIVPPVGGDTLWASMYSVYDRLDPGFRRDLESLSASHDPGAFRNGPYAEGGTRG